MFDKDAEEYYYKTYPVTLNIGEEERKKEVTDIFIKGAICGYNKANEWHHTSEKDFPTEAGIYLVYRKKSEYELLAFDGLYWITGARDDIEDTIIAWIELPESPKENK